MKFEVLPVPDVVRNKLIYRSEDYAFNVDSRPETGITSLLVNNLQLEIDENGQILYVWGYCPYQTWRRTDSVPSSFIQGILLVHLETEIIPGVSNRLTEPGAWPIFVNPDIGWVCVGELDSSPTARSVEFALNSVAVIEDGLLRALWLHPENLPEQVKEFMTI